MYLPLRAHRPPSSTQANPVSRGGPIAGPSRSIVKGPTVIECIEISSDEDEPTRVAGKGKGRETVPAIRPLPKKSAFLTQNKNGIYKAVARTKAAAPRDTEVIDLVDSSEDETNAVATKKPSSSSSNKPVSASKSRPQSPYDASRRPHSSHKAIRPPISHIISASPGVVRTNNRKHGGSGLIIARNRPLPAPAVAPPRIRRTVCSNVPHTSGSRPKGVPIVVDLSLDSEDEDSVVIIPNSQPRSVTAKKSLAEASKLPTLDGIIPSAPSSSSVSVSTSSSASSSASSSTFASLPRFDSPEWPISPATTPPDSIPPESPHLRSPTPQDTPIQCLEKRIAFETAIRSIEPNAPPIILENNVDDELVPPDAGHFDYSNDVIIGTGIPPYSASVSHTVLKGCNCSSEGRSCAENPRCICMRRQRKAVEMYGDNHGFRIYKSNGRLRRPTVQLLINECNMYCGCGVECLNRVVQKGRQVPLKLGKTKDRGWGVFAGPDGIPAGTFIGNYAGEMLTDEVLDKRNMINNSMGSSFALDVDYYWIKNQEIYSIDASLHGNFTRYLNHSCEPNCGIHGVYVDEGILNKATHCMFTSRDVQPGEELTISYHALDDEDVQEEQENLQKVDAEHNAARQLVCKCGTEKCVGRIFN